MHIISKVLSAGILSVAFAGSAYASTVVITNPSFEDPALPVGTYQGDGLAGHGGYGPSYAVGWSAIPGGATDGAQHLDAPFVPSDGLNVLYINSGGISQDVGTLLANHTYRLTVAVGNQTGFGPGSTGAIALLNGSTVLSSTLVSGQPVNAMQDFTTFFRTGSVVSGNLAIQLAKTDGQQLLFDNVRLTAVVPEPATWAMMIGGFGIVGGSLRARRSGSRKLATA